MGSARAAELWHWARRAARVKQECIHIGRVPRGQRQRSFVFDMDNLHAAHLRRRLFPTPVHIVFWAEGRDEASTLPTAAASGMTVEVGPLPNGVATAQIFRQTRELLRLALDWVEERNRAATSIQKQARGRNRRRAMRDAAAGKKSKKDKKGKKKKKGKK